MENEIFNIAQSIFIKEMLLKTSFKLFCSDKKIISFTIDYGDNKIIYREKNIQNREQINICFDKLLNYIKVNPQPFNIKLKLYDQHNSNTIYYQESKTLDSTNFESELKVSKIILLTYEWMKHNKKLQFNFNDSDHSLIKSILEIVNSREYNQYGYLTARKMKAVKKNNKIIRTLYYSHLIAPISELDQNNKIINKGNNIYFCTGINDFNDQFIMIEKETESSFIENYNPLKERTSLLKNFPYLANYLIDLQNWKYLHDTLEIPESVINQIKQKYIKEKSDKKIK